MELLTMGQKQPRLATEISPSTGPAGSAGHRKKEHGGLKNAPFTLEKANQMEAWAQGPWVTKQVGERVRENERTRINRTAEQANVTSGLN